MKNKWLKKNGDMVVRQAATVIDETANQLLTVSNGSADTLSEEDLKNLKRRKLVNQIVRKSYRVSRGPQYRTERVRKLANITKDMLGNRDEVCRWSLVLVVCVDQSLTMMTCLCMI